MAEPISIIGAIAAIANVVDVVSKSIKSISKVRDRWKEADLTLLSLAAQLTALRAALTKIQDWMAEDLIGDPYHQLVMDLDVSMKSCELLISKVGILLDELGNDVDKPLDFTSIVKLVFKGRSIEDVQRLIEQQTGALTLLLTACNCKSLSEQKGMLQKSRNRKVLGRAQFDSASLYVHRDSNSIISRFTDNLSKLSIVFDFDSELFASKIYQQILRGSVKQALKREQDNLLSWKIDRRLQKDARSNQYEHKVIVLGTEASGRRDLMKMIKILHNDNATGLLSCRLDIHKHIIKSVADLIGILEKLKIIPEKEVNREHHTFLRLHLETLHLGTFLDIHVGEAISSLWKDPCVSRIVDLSSEFSSASAAHYFFADIERISSPNYVPTIMDVCKADTHASKLGIHETLITCGGTNLRFIEVIDQPCHAKKYIRYLEELVSFVFVVDLTSYDTKTPGNSKTEMVEAMDSFDSIVNSQWCIESTIMLILNNRNAFEEKLSRSALNIQFPYYTGGDDVNKAMLYIASRFLQVNRTNSHIFVRVFDLHEPAVVSQMVDTIEKSGYRERVLSRDIARTLQL